MLMDFIDHPEFVRELLHAVADYNIAQAREAMKYDIDAVHCKHCGQVLHITTEGVT